MVRVALTFLTGVVGISFAAIGSALGHPVRIYLPDWMSQERVDLLRSFGAELVPVSAADGGFVESIRRADEWARENEGTFRPRQFDSPAIQFINGPFESIVRQFGTIAAKAVGDQDVGAGGCIFGMNPGHSVGRNPVHLFRAASRR